MSEAAEREPTELVAVPSKDAALEAFKAEKGLDPYLAKIRGEVDLFLTSPPALDTNKGRQAYASMAHKVARSKTAIDNLGKELVADLKQLPKTIDAERKRWRDTLDEWRDEVRGPLNTWEADEQSRKDQHKANIDCMVQGPVEDLPSKEIAMLITCMESNVIDETWEEFESEAHRVKAETLKAYRTAMQKRELWEAEQAELERLRAEQASRDQKDREERIAREAEDRVRRESDQLAQAERDAVARREQAARDESARKDREYQEAIATAKRDAEQAAQRIEAEHKRKEDERMAEDRRQQEDLARRQADKDHRGAINRAALAAMVEGGMPEDCAKQAVTLIAKGQVPGITINY